MRTKNPNKKEKHTKFIITKEKPMVIKIKLLNKNFDDSFAVSVNGERKELSTQENAADFEIGNSPEIELKIKHVRHEIHSIKNPFEKFFAFIIINIFQK